MLPLQFFDIVDIDKSIPKPTITGSTWQYNSLTPRHFEMLVYLLYKNEVENGALKSDYTSVSLMQGIRDHGIDSMLRKGGKAAGIIQCKKWSSPVGKDEAGKEIIKFLLNYLLEKTLIDEPRAFTYFFVACGGFKDEATHILDDFADTATQPVLLVLCRFRIFRKQRAVHCHHFFM